MAKFKTVAEVFEDPTRWCKGSYAEAADGTPVDPYGERACKWCLLGAVMYVYGVEYWRITNKLYDAIHARGCKWGAVRFNDTANSAEEVRQLAIEAGV